MTTDAAAMQHSRRLREDSILAAIPLTLRAVGGLTTAEIARALREHA